MRKRLQLAYISIGALYGGCRSYYWLTRLNEVTYTDNPNRMKVEHPPILSTWLHQSIVQVGTSMVFWPLYVISDISTYQKSKLNIRDMIPPFPYNSLKWK